MPWFGFTVIPGVEKDGGEDDMKLDEDYRWRLNAVYASKQHKRKSSITLFKHKSFSDTTSSKHELLPGEALLKFSELVTDHKGG